MHSTPEQLTFGIKNNVSQFSQCFKTPSKAGATTTSDKYSQINQFPKVDFADRHLLIFGAAIPKRSQTVLRRCETAVNSIFDRPMPLRSLATPSFDYNRRFTVSRCPVVAPPDSNSPVR
jgi:hypothetical protein